MSCSPISITLLSGLISNSSSGTDVNPSIPSFSEEKLSKFKVDTSIPRSSDPSTETSSNELKLDTCIPVSSSSSSSIS